jgi:hypothetical protein
MLAAAAAAAAEIPSTMRLVLNSKQRQLPEEEEGREQY